MQDIHDNSEEETDEDDTPPSKRQRERENKKMEKININKKKRMNGKSYVGKRMSEEVLKEPRVMGSRCKSAACVNQTSLR